MKHICQAVLLLSLLTIALPAVAKHGDKADAPPPGPAPVANYGETTTFTLPNGLHVIIVENHKLPSFTVDLQFAIKPALEQDHAGYRGMMGELLQYGTQTKTKAQIAHILDQTSTDLVTTDEEIAARGIAREQETILGLVSDIAMNAAIKPEDVELLKSRTISQLQARQNDGDALLSNVASALNYGSAHPYGQIITDKTIGQIKAEDCISYYTTYFKPNVAYLAIVGDITVEAIKSLVEKYFGTWRNANVPVTEYNHPDAPMSPGIAFIPRKNAVQNSIRITYPVALLPGSGYAVKARVANTILGGSSQSLLAHDLRQAHPWAYTTYSSILENENEGSFTAYARCRAGADDSCVALILADMQRMQTNVDNSILDRAKWTVTGNYALSLTDPANIATYAINTERYRLPKEYYSNYLKTVSSISAADIKDVASKFILPNNAHIIITGSIEDTKKFTRFSTHPIDYYDNNAQKIPAPNDNQNQQSLADMTSNTSINNTLVADIIKKYISAIGGEAAITSITSIKKVSTGKVSSGPSSLELTITEVRKAPSKMAVIVEGMEAVMQKQVLNGNKGYTEVQGKKKQFSPADVDNMKAEADIQKILHSETYGITRTLHGTAKVKGSEAFVINATDHSGRLVVEYYDINTGYLVQKEETDTKAGGKPKITEYSDYRAVPNGNGYKLPYSTQETEGKHVASSSVKTVEINKDVSDSVFN